MQIEHHTKTINGHEVHYLEAGTDFSGTDLLLLHGGYGNAWLNWSEAMPLLADEYHVIAPDLPGYGDSAPIEPMNVDTLITWVQSLLDSLEIEQAVVVGNSFGGLIGRLFTANLPRYVPALVLINGGVIPKVTPIARLLSGVPVIGRALFRRIARVQTARSSLMLGIKTDDKLTDAFVAAVRNDVHGLARLMRALTISPLPEARTPAVPVLLLWGEEDAITPVFVAEHLEKEIPGSQISLIAGVGNMSQVEVPDVFAWQVKQFLRELTRPRREQ
jgi:pimeloyl-ACP methyl ester carboxylesterase